MHITCKTKSSENLSVAAVMGVGAVDTCVRLQRLHNYVATVKLWSAKVMCTFWLVNLS